MTLGDRNRSRGVGVRRVPAVGRMREGEAVTVRAGTA